VRIDPTLIPSPVDELTIEALIHEVRALDDPTHPEPAPGSSLGASPPGGGFHLPAAIARAALDRVFTVWVTEARPRLQPSLLDRCGTDGNPWDPAILLARIDFTPDDPFLPNRPAIIHADEPSDDGRPYLLHTQLIQELLLLGEQEGGIVPAAPSLS